LLGGKIEKKLARLVKEKIIELLTSIPPKQLKSITPDRGKEFAKHDQVTQKLHDVSFYFPDPHAPWQRETKIPMACLENIYQKEKRWILSQKVPLMNILRS